MITPNFKSLTSLSNAQIVAELGWTRKAIRAVIGVTPVLMRPPKGDIGLLSTYL
jgi:Polysaccharide deacetylase